MADAAAAAAARRRQQQQALFAAEHAELLSEARGVAFEFGANVRAIACGLPDGAAVAHEFIGAERAVDTIGRVTARDVAAMGLEQVAAHERKLQALRAVVARELQARAAAKAKAAAAGAKRAPEQQRTTMAGAAAAGGSNKIRKTG